MLNKAFEEMQNKARLSSFQLVIVARYIEWMLVIKEEEVRKTINIQLTKHNWKKVEAIDMLGNKYGPYESIIIAGKKLNVHPKNISKAAMYGHKWKGYYWRYV